MPKTHLGENGFAFPRARSETGLPTRRNLQNLCGWLCHEVTLSNQRLYGGPSIDIKAHHFLRRERHFIDTLPGVGVNFARREIATVLH